MTIERTYLGLIRAGLWGGKAQWPVEETEALLRLNLQQGTGALVFPSVLPQEDIPSYARAHMKSVCMSTMQEQVKLQYTLQRAWQALEKADVHAVLMKGAGLAALYPEPYFRSWGDIDLFVGKDQYHPACAVMRDTFPDALTFDEELDHYKHYKIIADGVSIETHRVSVSMQHPIDEKRYARMEQQGMLNAELLSFNDLTVRVPEPTFNALFVFLHAWEHMLTKGANMRQLCDLALLLHHYASEIDKPRLKRWLKSLHLLDVWQLFMYILVKGLGLPVDEALCYTDKSADRAEHLLTDLLYGRLEAPVSTKESPKGRLARKLFTMRGRLGNAKRMMQYSPAYARHMAATVLLNGARRFFAKDRHWE